ncbi:MAG: RluA family pseudouridine synthase [Pseudomonadota bacterium]
MADTLRVTIGPSPPGRLDKALSRDAPEEAALSRSRLARLIDEGAVSRNGVVLTEAKARVGEGDVLDIVLPEVAESHMTAEPIALDIRYEDDDLIVVNKPAGMVVHPAPGTPSGTLVNALLAHCGNDLSGVGGVARPGIVHRIDKDTSGLLVAAKTDAAHAGLSDQFAAHRVERLYLALCHGCPDPANPRLRGVRGVSIEPGATVCITSQLARHRTERQRQVVVWSGGRHAVTRLRVRRPLGEPPAAALVACQLETGRTHQIRVHMAHIGHGLIGDPVYGGRRKISARSVGEEAAGAAHDFGRQALHAATLGFNHPLTQEAMRFDADLPADMAQLLELLSGEGRAPDPTG